MTKFIINESKATSHNSPTLFSASFNQSYPLLNSWTSNNLLSTNIIKSFIAYSSYINNYNNSHAAQNNYSFFGLYDITKSIYYKDINNV